MYYAIVNWFNDFESEDQVSHIFVTAQDWNDAMQKISNQFNWIDSLEIKLIDAVANAGVIYVPPECVDAIIEENSY